MNNLRSLSFFDRSILNQLVLPEETEEIQIEPFHIATALIALKSRHRLSNQCVEDILDLLRLFSDKVPSSYKGLCTLLRKRSIIHAHPTAKTICPHCDRVSSKLHACTACKVTYSPIPTSTIPLFFTYDITQQISSIVSSSPDLLLPNRSTNSTFMKDIIHGNVYRKLVSSESETFLTMVMNVDGIQPNKGSDQSLWPVLFVINEIERKKRFSLENLIIGGMWPGPSKPTRSQMSIFLQHIVSQLQALEQGRMCQIYSPDENIRMKFIKVFLIASCCDKPAQSLIQCLPEPTAFFGCGNCELEGMISFTSLRV